MSLKDLVNQNYLTEDYYFDEKEASDFHKFASKLWLPDGLPGQLISLLTFQLVIAIEILAIKRKKDHSRRFREVFITMPRKNAKSFLVALIMVYIFFTDPQRGQQNIIVANSRDQAANVYKMIKYMVENNPTLMKHCRIVDSRREIIRHNGSYIKVMSSDAGRLDSFKPFVAMVDETHEDTTRGESFTKLQTGMGQWDEPLIFSVTTASDGQDKHNLEYEKYQYAKKVESGEIKDDAFYSAIYRADDDCDLLDEKQWIKANPGIDLLPGGFRKSEEIGRLAKQAVLNPVKEPNFRRYYLNQHVVLINERAINMEYWNASAAKEDLSFLKGRACYAGMDLSILKDFTAFVLVFPVDDKYYVIPYLFKPADTLVDDAKTDEFPYPAYAKQGYIEATKGDFVNHRHVRQKIGELARIYDIKEIVFDKFSSSGIASDLQNDGFIMVDHIQGFGFSPTISDFYDLLFDDLLRHDGNPVMTWMAENTRAKENSTGKIMFDKEQGKIDGIVAMLMGLTRAIANNKTEEYDPNKAIEEWAAANS
ncbi:terminase large subunit [Oceanobacillus profundus]|uniref:terminase large subunit n=1 Tax=Oceanobacillus profundus TaxID=372463 RepID=UPI002041B910|nr:terminase TerL endonuclease subunit [Oceanobacillus profundus]MCM3396793.1 terminase large subunit [Oceanobacillus profundus]